SELAPLQVALDVLGQEAQPGRQPIEDAHQRRAVRLAGGEEAQPAHAEAALRRSGARWSSCGRLSQISSEAMAWWTSTSRPSMVRQAAAFNSAVGPAGA